MIRNNGKKGGENPTEIPLHFLENDKKQSSKKRRGTHVVDSPLFGGENTSSKEEEGVCSKIHTLPPFVHEEAPTQTPETLSFFLDFNGRNPPTVTHQMHRVTVRNGKPQFFDSPELAKARADLCAHLEQHSPDAPFEGPLSLAVVWRFKDSKGREGWKDTKPDTDNLEKLLKDCMTRARFWIDDAQVCEEHVFKRWSKTPGIAITVRAL